MPDTPFEHSEEMPASRRLMIFAWVLAALVVAGLAVLLYLALQRRPRDPAGYQLTKVIRGVGSQLLESPLDVAVYTDKIFVTDAKNRRVVAYLRDGQPLFDFRGGGIHDVKGSKLVYPVGIAVSGIGEIYVTDSGSGRVVIFSESGRALRFIDIPNHRKVVPKPLAIAIDKHDNVFVAEAKTGNVYEFDKTGSLRQQIGNGKLAYANGIAVSAKGEIYVSDSNNQQIVVFSRLGIRRKVIRLAAEKSFLPRGLAFDKNGDLLVADTLGFRVVEFDERGRQAGSWGSPGSGLKQMLFPNGIDYANGLLYVVDRGNNRVVIWHHIP